MKTHKHFPTSFFAAALLISLAETGFAQVGMQQMPGATGGSSSGVSRSYEPKPAGCRYRNAKLRVDSGARRFCKANPGSRVPVELKRSRRP